MSPRASANLQDMKVLVVDADKGCCEHASLLLKRLGVHTTWTLSGEKAIEMVLAAHEANAGYDVCFIDWQMPDIDGLQTTRRIREHLGPETLIIISAYDWSSIEAEARMAGADAFIAKPLFQSAIYDTLLGISGKPGSAAPQASTDSKAHFTGRRILLAEDNLLNREIALELLGSAGVLVDTAENGLVALRMFEASPPNHYAAILMDVQMPEMDGHACTRAIRALSRPDAALVPIIAMTPNAFSEDVAAALTSGMNEHVAKPIDVQILYATLDRYFSATLHGETQPAH